MNNIFLNLVSPLVLLLRRLLPVILVLTLARLVFWSFNTGPFSWPGIGGTAEVLGWGAYFDLISVFYWFSPFILAHLIPGQWKHRPLPAGLMKGFWVLIIGVLCTLTFIDAGYFPFSKTRLDAGLFRMAAEEDISIMRYVADYWWFVPVILLFGWLSFRWYPKPSSAGESKWFLQVPANILFLAILVFTIRGGTRLKPLRSIDTALFVRPSHAALAISTGFNLLESLQAEHMKVPAYFSAEELKAIQRSDYYPPAPEGQFLKKNIVILIIESFGKEYTFPDDPDQKTYAPFLRELAGRSLFFNHAMSNGTRSVDAIPAILEGVPKLTRTDFMYSNYIRNQTPGFPHYLSREGYQCSFYHGGKNGTLGFEAFLRSKGWSYSGKDQYKGDPSDFDGQWGIYDGPYLNFVARELDKQKQPFVASVFTLSSHHPYSLPASYRDSFRDVPRPIHKTIRYTDRCLREFFELAGRSPWFKNTLFVITADHSAENFTRRYQTTSGRFEVPLMLYDPSDEKGGVNTDLVQHIDILPMVLSHIGYRDTLFTLSTWFLPPEKKAAFQNMEGEYQLIHPGGTILFNGTKITSARDAAGRKLDPSDDSVRAWERFLKGKIQDYSDRLIANHYY